MIRTLRDFARPEIRKELRKLLSLECVRNKDRMSIDPILRLSQPRVLQILADLSFVVHTIAPETYKLWNTNLPGKILHPIDICMGEVGKLMVCDRGIQDNDGKLLEIKLHYPADVVILQTELAYPASITFMEGVAFVAQTGANCVTFCDVEDKVKLKVKSLLKPDLIKEVQERNMPTDGYVKQLQDRLQNHMNKIDDNNNVVMQVQRPTAVVSFKDQHTKYLLCAEQDTKQVQCSQLIFNGDSVTCIQMYSIHYPESVDSLRSIVVSDHSIVVSICHRRCLRHSPVYKTRRRCQI